MPQSSSLTPMLRHYLEVKEQHPDAILFYRMGDFYELFFDDAEQAAPLLEVALTARQKGTESEAPMCGVPHHALEGYVGKLLRAGLKVAICDQVEDPKQAKGLVRREVTRVVTPGTVSSPELLEGREENLLAALVWRANEGGGAFLDLSTGAFFARRWQAPQEARDDLAVLRPREVLLGEDLPESVAGWVEKEVPCRTALAGDRWLDRRRAATLLAEHLGVESLRGFGLTEGEPVVEAAASALAYAGETQGRAPVHVRELEIQESRQRMVVDATTLANLEVFTPLKEGGRKATLVSVVDRTVTPGGGRLLRRWLRRPLLDPAAIDERLEAVAELVERVEVCDEMRRLLPGTGDPERLLSRAVLGTITPREIAVLRDALRDAPRILGLAQGCRAAAIGGLGESDPLAELAGELARCLVETPAASVREGPVVAESVDEELDRCRSLARDSKRHILALERRERERTGIASLKVRFNRVFGYYLEVTKANQHLVPPEYVRRQTLANAERYVTPEVKELEEQILSAEERRQELERRHLERLAGRIVEEAGGLRRLAAALATLDGLSGFAEVARRERYARPAIGVVGGPIVVREGRHPVVEKMTGSPFVPNDVELDGATQVVILTGPNMGGKSTYLRQVALAVLLAQAGSFVPASSASIGPVDRIFTRVGASDDLARGESTFMVEMIETANILRQAGPSSLVVLDEVGRGTATFDGLALAWAVVEHLHDHRGAKTLFATHFHELTELSALLPRIVNRTMAVKEWRDRIIFLRRVVPGAADKSYGLHVAKLAGVPSGVVARAEEILANLESEEYDLYGRPRIATGDDVGGGPSGQLSLFSAAEERVAMTLREADLGTMTPIAALNLLHRLQAELGAAGERSASAPRRAEERQDEGGD